MRQPSRVLAVDWSGDARAETGIHAKLWVAEAVDGRLISLEPSSRQRAVAQIQATADRHGSSLTVGLDFAFSYPAWFLAELGVTAGPELWEVVDDLDFSRPPFFGWAGSRAPVPTRRFRRTEAALRARGFAAKSAFQLNGPGSVGTGSRRGMPHLAALRRAGFAVWPFDPAEGTGPVVTEIYPRMATGPVVKSDLQARERTVERMMTSAEPGLRARAVTSEDAFDAALSAVVFSAAEITDTPVGPVPDAALASLEGWVWEGIRSPACGPGR